jgi:biofilm protein TabA
MIVSKFSNSDNNANLPAAALDIINEVANQDLEHIELGKYPIKEMPLEDAHFVVMEYETEAESQFGPEFHRVYTDVQFLIKGEEKCGWAIASDAQLSEFAEKFSYNPVRDICFINPNDFEMNFFKMQLGEFYVFTPNTLHMPNLNVQSTSKVRKVVIKIKTTLIS